MSFNRRGGPDRRPDRPPRPGGRGNYPPRDRGGYPPRDQGGGYPPRDREPRPEGGYAPREPRPEGGDRPYGRPAAPRRFERAPDEGGMTMRLDPRRLRLLKELAGEVGMRPGDLARQWVEERIDLARGGQGGTSLEDRLTALEARIAAVEGQPAPDAAATPEALSAPADPAVAVPSGTEREPEEAPSFDDAAAVVAGTDPDEEPAPDAEPAARRTRVTAAPSARVGLHDEMIAVLSERGPMTAGELAAAISERGRYVPPRSGRAIDAAMVSQRASNPTYRSRFLRREGRIGLADAG